MSGPQPKPQAKQCFYLVDQTQSAHLNMFLQSRRALADLIAGSHHEADDTVEVRRAELAALVLMDEYTLGAILNGYDYRTVWVNADGTPGELKL